MGVLIFQFTVPKLEKIIFETNTKRSFETGIPGVRAIVSEFIDFGAVTLNQFDREGNHLARLFEQRAMRPNIAYKIKVDEPRIEGTATFRIEASRV